MTHEFTTPMMKQYMKIKRQYEDCLLFFRMGDFYELFLEDAHIGSQVLDITLTSRPKGKDGKIPMAGVPYHAVDSYLSKLVKAGYKVAICEQVSLPNKYGIVDREVIRVVTPGTILDEHALERKMNNYLIALDVQDSHLSISYADLSTGQFGVLEKKFSDLGQTLRDELIKLSPVECVMREEAYNDPNILKYLKEHRKLNIFPFATWESYAQEAEKQLKKHFGVSSLAAYGIEDRLLSQQTASALLGYLKETQKTSLSHIRKIETGIDTEYLLLDRSSIINLELFSTIRDHDVRGSLLHVLDDTLTPMGGRMLKLWMRKPLMNKEQIEKRYDAVEEVFEQNSFRSGVRNLLSKIPDLERTLSRLSLNIGNARDLINLKDALVTVLAIREALETADSSLLKNLYGNVSPELSQAVSIIETTIADDAPVEVKEGGIIKRGIHAKLDEMRATVAGSRDWILELERAERERTGIASLKVRFNKVFGFYIEVSNANLKAVPDTYIRKQTLVNGERFITPELKKHEEIILSAEEKIKALEFEIYSKTLQQVLEYTENIQKASQGIGILDCIATFAELAHKNNYVRPELRKSGGIHITGGRHPVVEKLLDAGKFVPNDVILDESEQQLLLITGPNMAGKSVFIRQLALIVLMAQMGCWVPADHVQMGIVDRIFVRSGASDVITSGLSTFMVEMVETAYILNHATENSLIIMDEIGRGTSTYDGISIAWAVAEYLVSHFELSPKTLFATHYHELQALEEQYPERIRNFHMTVTDDSGTPIFLYTLQSGGASHSFGVAVAQLAGIPDEVITRAQEMLKSLENRRTRGMSKIPESSGENGYRDKMLKQVQHDKLIDILIHKELDNLDIHRMTPLDALNKLSELKDKIRLTDVQNDESLGAD